MKLSERILAIAETEIIGVDIFEKWAQEVEDLEDTRDGYKALYEQTRADLAGMPEVVAQLQARIEALKETDAGKLQAEVDGTIRVQMSYIATLESRIEALKKAAREYADAVIEGNATLGQQKRLHDLLDQKGRPR